MDPRLRIEQRSRAEVPDELADVPLVTMAWRILKRHHRRLSERLAERAAERDILLKALANVRLDLYRAEQEARAAAGEDGDTGLSRLMAQIVGRLDKVGLELAAPVGEPFTPERMELLESVAQLPRVGIEQAIVAELIEPAILYDGELLIAGRAVIAIPYGPSEAGVARHDCPDGSASGRVNPPGCENDRKE